MQVTCHQVTLTIAAIFDNGNELLSAQILVCSQKSICYGYIISCMQLLICYVIITPQTFEELLRIV